MQGHAALAVELGAGHLSAAETTGALDLDALGAGLHRALHALTHGATEGDAGGQLLRDALSHELGVQLGVLDLKDVQLDLLAGQLLKVAADAVGLGAATADDDAGTRGVDVHPHTVTGALDLNLRDAGALHAGRHHPTDGDVFLDVVLVQLVGVPAGLEVRGDAEAEPVRVYLLAHYRVPSFDARTTVMWLVRLRIRYARPWARGRKRFRVGPSSTNASATYSDSTLLWL